MADNEGFMPEKQKNFVLPDNRFILLGASNLTLSLRLVIHLMQQQLGAPSEIVAAVGHGRAYGTPSRMLMRGLPSIADCGLWHRLAETESCPSYALLTDIGNDILYESPPEQLLRAVAWCISRLQRQPVQIVATNLPLRSIERLSEGRYLIFRNLFYPFCKLSLVETVRRARIVHEGLLDMAASMHFKLYEQDPVWFGLDGIHANYWQRKAYYRDMLAQFPVPDRISTSRQQAHSLTWQQRPTVASKTVFGRTINCPQPSGRLSDGSPVATY